MPAGVAFTYRATEEMRSDVERDDDKARTAEEAAAEKAMNKHPASPEQTGDKGFAEGYEHVPETPEEELDEQREPNFARGISHEDTPGTEHHGRFSEGEEDAAGLARRHGRAPVQRGERGEPYERVTSAGARSAASTRRSAAAAAVPRTAGRRSS